MKNIHVLPTNKPSRLNLGIQSHSLAYLPITIDKTSLTCPQNIYITDDSEIKEGDWVIAIEGIWKNTITKVIGEPVADVWRKIILTTEKDLIQDGVQAIDDEFLEWFVKNPNCEKVEVEEIEPVYGHQNNTGNVIYRLIIPNLEIWKDIPEFEGYYQVSNLGNVRSLNYGKIRELKPRLVGYDGNQYLAVNLSKESKVKSVKVHKLVALCFLNHTSKGYNGLVIDHIDSNKLNNRLDNLKLVTPRFNASKDKQGSSSKFTGVTWHKKSKKWQCQIYDNGKLNHLGLFNTEIEASKTYNNYLENMKKEEPKQDLLHKCTCLRPQVNCFSGMCSYCNRQIFKNLTTEDLKQKQETTLEEAAENYSEGWGENDDKKSFIAGAKWQTKRMYSEEELKSAFKVGFNIGYGSPVQELDLKNEHRERWFEQFSKLKNG